MRRAVAALLAALLALPCVWAQAAEKTYRLDELGLSLRVPTDGFDVYVRGMAWNEFPFYEYGYTAVTLGDYALEHHRYLIAVEPDGAREFYLAAFPVEAEVENLADWTDAELDAELPLLRADYEAEGHIWHEGTIYEHPQTPFVRCLYSTHTDGGQTHSVQHYTIYRGMGLQFILHRFDGQLGEDDLRLARRIVDSVCFDDYPAVPEAPGDAPSEGTPPEPAQPAEPAPVEETAPASSETPSLMPLALFAVGTALAIWSARKKEQQ